MVTVASDGPFSTFSSVDCTLALLEGEGRVLLPASRGPLRIGPASSPVSFPSELPVTAQLCDGPVVAPLQ
jgi:environmental stress-induced protein Ves